MKSKTFWTAAGRVLTVAAVTLVLILTLTPITWAQSKFKTLHTFTGADGQEPLGRLILDAAGSLYGMTYGGGAYGEGTVFELKPNADGTWAESLLYSFSGGTDGAEPIWSSLAFDLAGNLYGTTTYGGRGYGVVFELTPNLDGTWTESVLYSFSGGKGGAYPMTIPVLDQSSNLYGTTVGGGRYGYGTVFKLTPNHGNWTESVLHSFTGGKDGADPYTGLIFDTAGNLYGTTRNGGRSTCDTEGLGCGTVFQLTPGAEDKWTYHVIHRFTGGRSGFDPSIAGLVLDPAGTLYSSTEYGGLGDCGYAGNPGCGTIFKLIPGLDNKWSHQLIHRFTGGKAGGDPFGVILDGAGNLFGTTVEGGRPGCDQECGTVFKLWPNSGLGELNQLGWNKSVLHRFTGGKDGGNPNSGLVLDRAGNIYGTTIDGGANGAGVVFEITP